MADKNVKFSITAQNKTAAPFKAIKSGLLSLSRSATGIGAALTAAVGIAGLGVMGKAAMDSGDKIQKLSTRLGASTEALSQYRHVADMTGVSFETMTMGWQRMTRRVAEAAQETGEAQGALEELGVAAEELNQLRPEDQFEALADRLMEVENPADRVRLAMKLFDSEGVSLIQMMQGGSKGLRSMREEADALGMTITANMANRIAAANDAVGKITNRIKGLVTLFMSELSPVILQVADDVGEWIGNNRALIEQNIKGAIDTMVIAFKGLRSTFKELWPAMDTIIKGFASIIEAGRKAHKFMSLPQSGRDWSNQAQTEQFFRDTFGDAGAAEAAAAVAPGAAAIAAAGGGAGFTGQDAEDWSFGAEPSGGTTVVNINSQYTRSDAVAILAEADRQGARQ